MGQQLSEISCLSGNCESTDGASCSVVAMDSRLRFSSYCALFVAFAWSNCRLDEFGKPCPGFSAFVEKVKGRRDFSLFFEKA